MRYDMVLLKAGRVLAAPLVLLMACLPVCLLLDIKNVSGSVFQAKVSKCTGEDKRGYLCTA